MLHYRFATITQVSMWKHNPYKTENIVRKEKKKSNNTPFNTPIHCSCYRFCLKYPVLETRVKDCVNVWVRWWNIEWSVSVDKDDWELEWRISDWQKRGGGMEWHKSFSGLFIGPSMVNPRLRHSAPTFPKPKGFNLMCQPRSGAMGLNHTRTDFGPIRKWIILSRILTTFFLLRAHSICMVVNSIESMFTLSLEMDHFRDPSLKCH